MNILIIKTNEHTRSAAGVYETADDRIAIVTPDSLKSDAIALLGRSFDVVILDGFTRDTLAAALGAALWNGMLLRPFFCGTAQIVERTAS